MLTDLPNDTQFLDAIEQFCGRHQMRPSTFGRLAAGDASLIEGLRSGRSVRLCTANRIADFMRSYAQVGQ